MSWWIDAEYVKPTALDDLYPDLDFEVNPQTLFCASTGSAAQKKRKRASTGAPPLCENAEYNKLLHHLKTKFRRPRPQFTAAEQETKRLESVELFVVDVADRAVQREKYPSAVLDRYPRSSRLPGNAMLPVLLVFGVVLPPAANAGCSVCVHVFDAFPYFLVECPSKFASQAKEVMTALEAVVAADSGALLAACELVEGESMMDYDPSHTKTFFKLTFFNARGLNICRNLFEKQYQVKLPSNGQSVVFSQTVFENSVPFTLRWMIDNDISGCDCISFPEITLLAAPARISRCDLEGFTAKDPVVLAPPKQSMIPNDLRILALDIECVSHTNKFPSAQSDPVIQISMILTQFDGEPLYKAVLTLAECSPLPEAETISFSDEKAMLQFWRDMINILDPDFLTGYNFINFDLAYLIERSETLDVVTLRNFGRLLYQENTCRDSQIQSKQMGVHDFKEIQIHGRVQYDLYEIIRRDHKLKSYSLNHVSSQFLKEQKEDVHYSEMKSLQEGGPESRKRIAVYCLKDSWLVVRLIQKLSCLVNTVEMARVTGVSVNLLTTRGQQIKVTSQILRKAKSKKLFMPNIRRSGGGPADVQYEGATVLEPLRGYYKDAIVTLDFASLYPSIMIAHNLCYTTLIPSGNPETAGVKAEECSHTPANKCFVKASVREGLLPAVVFDLLEARKRVKRELKTCEDAFQRKVLDGRQLALKVSANSVYGYTGAVNNGQLPCLAISESITAYGREMIDFTKQQVEGIFTRANGYSCDAKVVYGDTDSVMINFGAQLGIPKSMTLGLEASVLITQKFVRPISLEFEKVFCPFLLMNKKRYAGLKWTQGCVPKALLEAENVETGAVAPTGRQGYPGCSLPVMDCKGIETVRRDFCTLIQQVTDDVLNMLLLDQDVEGAIALTKTTIQRLLHNEVDMSYLVMSKSIGKEDYTGKMAHIELAKKLKERDPLNAPSIGDRVYYVVIAGYKNQAQYERAEDPLYVLENNIPIDTEFYLDSLRNVLSRIFEPLNVNMQSIFSLSNFSQKKALVKATTGGGGGGGLGAFVKKGLRCLLCKSVIQAGSYCKRCLQLELKAIEQGVGGKRAQEKETCPPSERPILSSVHTLMTDYWAKTREHQELWTQCQTCQGSLLKDVICVNRDCPIFYRRIKVKKDLNDMLKEGPVGRLQADDPLDW